MTLTEVLVAVVILAVISPVLYRTFTYAITVQHRRAVQEEVLIFASDYLEYTKYQFLSDETTSSHYNSDPFSPDHFDTVRPFRGDTLQLIRQSSPTSVDGILEEQFSIVVDSNSLGTFTHAVPVKKGSGLW